MRLMLPVALLFVGLTGCGEAPDRDPGSEAAVHWIDVRSPEEYDTGHREGAVNIPHDEIGERIGEVTDDKTAEIHLYCRSGNRAGKAEATLERLGYENVTNEGGKENIR